MFSFDRSRSDDLHRYCLDQRRLVLCTTAHKAMKSHDCLNRRSLRFQWTRFAITPSVAAIEDEHLNCSVMSDSSTGQIEFSPSRWLSWLSGIAALFPVVIAVRSAVFAGAVVNATSLFIAYVAALAAAIMVLSFLGHASFVLVSASVLFIFLSATAQRPPAFLTESLYGYRNYWFWENGDRPGPSLGKARPSRDVQLLSKTGEAGNSCAGDRLSCSIGHTAGCRRFC
jgi:hypothetical protein